MQRRDDFLTVDGVRLAARGVRPRAAGGPALVFLHEGLGCLKLWRDLPERLAARTGVADGGRAGR